MSILSNISLGYLGAQQKHQEEERQNAIKQNQSLLSGATEFLKNQLPNMRPEAQQIAMQSLSDLMGADPYKLKPKQASDLANKSMSFLWQGLTPPEAQPQTMGGTVSGAPSPGGAAPAPADLTSGSPGAGSIPGFAGTSQVAQPSQAAGLPMDLSATLQPLAAPQGYRQPALLTDAEKLKRLQATKSMESDEAIRVTAAAEKDRAAAQMAQEEARAKNRFLTVPGGGLYDSQIGSWIREPNESNKTRYLPTPEGGLFDTQEGKWIREPDKATSASFEMQAANDWLNKVEPNGKTRRENGKGLADFNEYNKRIVPDLSFARNNPGGGVDKVGYIADQLALDASPAAKSILIGSDKQLQKQVTDELARRGTTLDQLTSSTRQLAQTAKDLVPTFNTVLAKINTPAMQAKLGPILGRWSEFEAGKIGAGDPDFAKLRVAVDLLKTGTIKAHFGARGGGQILERFDSLADAGKMDAATLSAALEGMRDFLNDTYVKPRYGETGPLQPLTPPAGATPRKAPAIGTIEDGHKYLGGNPADPKSWQKVP